MMPITINMEATKMKMGTTITKTWPIIIRVNKPIWYNLTIKTMP